MTLSHDDLDTLRAAHASGARFDYLFFWGHTPRAPAVIDAACLSQWAPISFEAHGERFATAEHYMMWGKARLFDDGETGAQILAAATPAQAKHLGRQVRGFDELMWRAHRLELVTQGNIHKFSQHAECAAFLRATGERVLVEASPMDRVWGIGLRASDPRALDPGQWRGLNLLGFALMRARSALGAC